VSLTADRVRQLLSYRETITRATRPMEPPDETELRLELDRLFARLMTAR
jgi:hypothetical protein